MKTFLVLIGIIISAPTFLLAQEYDSSLPPGKERSFLKTIIDLEGELTDKNDALENSDWTLRSQHFVFGMPRLTDSRHNFIPIGYSNSQPGISIVVREGFVAANFDRMKSPLWVAQRWTKYDYLRLQGTEALKRYWREDLQVPKYSRGGTSYRGSITKLDRGHMARHEMNRAWGTDSSQWGTKMTNSAPQHKAINRGSGSAWRALEDAVRDAVKEPSNIDVLWTISGAIFRDTNNSTDEFPEDDFIDVVRLPDSDFGVPDATYKIVAWFTNDNKFHVRAYVFEQEHSAQLVDGQQKLTFNLQATNKPIEKYIEPVDQLEARLGIDFFPMLNNSIEDGVELTDYANPWVD